MTPDEKAVLSKAQRLSHWNAQKLFYCIGKSTQKRWTVKRGEVYFVDLGENIGSEENKLRPVVVLQSNSYNFRAPTFTAAIISNGPVTIPDIQVPITGNYAYTDNNGARKNLQGSIDLGQIKTVAKERIISKKICDLAEMNTVDQKLFNAFGLTKIMTSKDNTIASLTGKVTYLKSLLAQREDKSK